MPISHKKRTDMLNAETERTTDAASGRLSRRPRRLRRSPTLRRMVRETTINVDDFNYPVFVTAGRNIERPIGSMPGHAQRSVDMLARDIDEVTELGIPAVLLFGIPEEKDAL